MISMSRQENVILLEKNIRCWFKDDFNILDITFQHFSDTIRHCIHVTASIRFISECILFYFDESFDGSIVNATVSRHS